MVPVAIAVARRNPKAPAFQSGSRTIADATCVDLAHAGVFEIADAVVINILKTRTTTHANGIRHVAVAIACAVYDVLTQKRIGRPCKARSFVVAGVRVVAPLAGFEFAGTVVEVACIRLELEIACQGVGTPPNRNGTFTVAISHRHLRASAIEDCPWPVAHSAFIQFTYAIIQCSLHKLL